MNDIQNAFQQSLLAEAAYANLASAVGNNAQLLAALNVANKETYGQQKGSASIDFLTR